ncbi:PepSY domain-containing protein [Neptunicella sp. SCSIO 80796]|uniref:PepSY domain-containing protein n=1 Tax=Neptunicella plasticusilytica TaxID=3117012 RepID=UPI003A4DFB5C
MKYCSRRVVLMLTVLLTCQLSWAGMDNKELAIARKVMNESGVNAISSIQQVQQRYPGVIYDYELDDDDDDYYHEIKLIDLDADVKRKIVISAQNGTVVKEEQENLYSWFIEDDSVTAVKKLQALQYSMLTAIELVDPSEGALVVDIELEYKQGVVYFEIETDGPQGEQEILVDAKTRSVIPVYQR